MLYIILVQLFIKCLFNTFHNNLQRTMSFDGSPNPNDKTSIPDIRSSKETSNTTRDTVAPIGYAIYQGNCMYNNPQIEPKNIQGNCMAVPNPECGSSGFNGNRFQLNGSQNFQYGPPFIHPPEFISTGFQYPMVHSPGFVNYNMQIPFEYGYRFDGQQDPMYVNGNYLNTNDFSKSSTNKYSASNRRERRVIEDNFERCQFPGNNIQYSENIEENTGYINVDNGVIYKDMLEQRQLNENKHAKRRIADLKQYPSNQTLGDSLEHVRRTKQLGLPQISAAAAWKKAGRPDTFSSDEY